VELVKVNEISNLMADFDEDSIVDCELQFVGAIEMNREILWEGSLHKKVPDGETKFVFVLCFNRVGLFKMVIKHTAKSEFSGQTPVFVKVVEE
jgi:hypothetical protein